MKGYADLHLCPSLDDLANAKSMANLLMELRVEVVGLVVPPNRLTPLPPVVNLFKSAGVDVAKRLNLKPKSREELLAGLRRFRGRYEVIAVDCSISSVPRVAVRDRRVDIVRFPNPERGNLLRRNLATSCRAALEISISEFVPGPTSARLHSLRRQIVTACQAATTVIGSTGASNPFGLRSPRDVAALLHTAGLPLQAALKGVSEVPLAIVQKNRLRLEQPQLEEGVRIVRGSTRGA